MKLSLKVRLILRIESWLMKILVRITNYARAEMRKDFRRQMQQKLSKGVDNAIYEELMKHDRLK